MHVLPAIDIRGGKCVRLFQGDYAKETVYYDNPVDVARMWADKGAHYLHVVDLDGAREGRLVNLPLVEQMARKTDLVIEMGGGIRSLGDIRMMMTAGVQHPILGTRALAGATFLQEVRQQFGTDVVIGIDARDGRVAVEGWLNTSSITALELAQQVDALGFQRIIFTDIATDGAFTGPNLKAGLDVLAQTKQVQLTVSGGVSGLQDLQAIADCKNKRIFGVIVGKALYDHKIDLATVKAKGWL